MKKVLLVLLGCFLLVGCTNSLINNSNQTQEQKVKKSTLVCSLLTKADLDFVTEMSYYFENDKITKVGVKYTYDLSPYSEEQRNVMAGSKMCDTESFKTSLGMEDCKEELSGTNYIVGGYAQKLLEKTKGTQEFIKKSNEKDGWTCEIQ